MSLIYRKLHLLSTQFVQSSDFPEKQLKVKCHKLEKVK